MPSTVGHRPVYCEDLEALVARAAALCVGGRRTILGIVGAPGSGKSTLCDALRRALGSSVAVVGMDGFHLATRELTRLGLRDRKGAPPTFDVDGYVALLKRLSHQEESLLYAPLFDRGLEEPIANAVAIDRATPLVVTEGNYLLSDLPGWREVRAVLEEAWFLDVDPAERTRRLLARRRSFGCTATQAASWVSKVDDPNAAIVDGDRDRADVVIRLDGAFGARDGLEGEEQATDERRKSDRSRDGVGQPRGWAPGGSGVPDVRGR